MVEKDLQSVQLQSDKWEWLGSWAIDMDALLGDEVDKEGWEYGTSFGSFSIASRRRTLQGMDMARRRRWLRTRVPAAGSIDERFRPLTIFWDVQVLQSGTRRVEIRSGLQIRNVMPFAVLISLCGSAWIGEKEFGPIQEGVTFNIPLMQASASSVKIRPASFPYEWSQPVSCCVQTSDYTTMRDIQCEGDDLSPVCLRVLCIQKKKSLLVTIAPFIVISNRYSFFTFWFFYLSVIPMFFILFYYFIIFQFDSSYPFQLF